MNSTQWLSLLLGAVFAVPTALAADADLVPPSETLDGVSQEDWSRMWWQWAGSFERHESPVGDQSGALCHLKQSGPVWFLAGTYGTKRTHRTCTVPAGKYLFFPLINYVVMPRADRPVSCMAVMRDAAMMTEQVSGLLLELDGTRVPGLEAHRFATRQCFDMGELAEPKFRVYPSAANGYYVMLRPLSRGVHVLNFGGALPSMLQGVTYKLIVE